MGKKQRITARPGIAGVVGAIVAFAGELDSASMASALEASGWLPCDGRSLAITIYPALYAVIGRRYGGAGDGFALPDFRPAPPSEESASEAGQAAIGLNQIIKFR